MEVHLTPVHFFLELVNRLGPETLRYTHCAVDLLQALTCASIDLVQALTCTATHHVQALAMYRHWPFAGTDFVQALRSVMWVGFLSGLTCLLQELGLLPANICNLSLLSSLL